MGKLVKGLLVVLVALLGAVYFSQQPVYDGLVLHSRAYEEVEIVRDSHGIPTIRSRSFRDTLYGLGYAQAQDRLFNMHLNRMIPSGRMSEIFGRPTLETDIRLRTFGLRRAAEMMEQKLSQEVRENLQAYADGVNDYVASLSVLPMEFVLTNSDFHAWTITDSLTFMKLINLLLTLDHTHEFVREALAQAYGREQADLIFGNHGAAAFENTTIMNDEEL